MGFVRAGRCLGWGGGEVLTVLPEVEERVAELAIQAGEVAADEADAADVVAVGRNGGIHGLTGLGGERFLRLAGEGLPSKDELEVGIFAGEGMERFEILVLNGHLGVDEGGFESDEAGLAPTDGGELVDEHVLEVVLGAPGGVEAVEVEVEGGLVLDAEDVVDDGGEAVFEGVAAGAGSAVGGVGAF